MSPRTGYVYRVKARKLQRLGEASDAANAETSEAPASQSGQLCQDGYVSPTPTDVAVTAVPIVVTSTAADYFVLYASFEVDSTTVEYPVLVKKGEDGTTTLAENVAALPADRYRVEKYAVSASADVDGDCTDDITELDNLGEMNPVNAATPVTNGNVVIPDFETFDRLSLDYGDGDSVIKFLVTGRESEQLQIYFMDTVTFNEHRPFLSAIGVEMADVARGRLIYDQDLVADDGSPGVYRYRFTQQIESFSFTERVHTLLAANMPLLDDNLALWIRNKKLREFQDDLPLYRSSRIDIVFDDDIYGETDFLALNQAAGYGLLRELDADERPHPRDVVIYQALPNELPRVAGIISSVPQTPLSHVNLRATQDGVPNAFIADALENDDVSDLIGSHVYYRVTDTGYTLRSATADEVDAHFASSRPARTQTPQSDLTVTAITPLSDIDFDDWDAFGVKAANVAVLGTLEFPEGTVPDGFAIPLYFYDEFMKHNDLYDDIEDMLADSDFQTDYDTMASELKKLRKKIKKAEVPEWIETALTTMHGNYPDGQSLRYRSSTNNEDLPNFNGAGLYDSKTQNPEETEEDGISKSLKQVYASLWNFRAFLERDFHRIDHLSTYMGALVHPNYSDDRVNGVAVSADPATGTWRSYYVNAQVGEDLVTNPEVNSVPEELLLNPGGGYTLLALSNQVPRGDLLMTDDQMAQLRRRLVTIHDRFAELYGVRYGEAFAMEVEFKVTSDNVLAIKQARPWVFPPLTGRFDLDTEAHGGNPFTVRVRFSAPTTILRSKLRDRAVSVTGGRVTGARRTTYSPMSEWWEIDVTPDSLGDVTIAVAHNRPCNNVAAICTSDGKRLSNRLELTIKGYLNNPATGLPTMSGTAQVGETLTADTSGIVDEDGLENASYSYQWFRNDGTTDSGIQDSTDSTYALVSEDSGKTIKVQVSFTDNAGNEEALTSDATAVVAAATSPNNPATGAPTISGAAQVGETLTADASGIVDEDGLSNPTFSYQWIRNDGTTDSDIQDATGSTYTLVSQDSGKAIRVRVSFTDDLGYGEILTSAATAEVTAGSNRTATGLPTITGTLEVLQTLRAQTSGIGDDDGLDNVSFEYQWAALDGGLEYDIQGATGPTYTLRSAELGKTIKVRVSFDDDRGYRETLTSAATEEVSPAPNTRATGSPTIRGSWAVLQVLTASTAGIADENGVDSGSFTYQWLAVDGGVDTDIEGATNPAYRLSSAEHGKAIKVRVGFIDNAGNEETLTSAATATTRADRLGRQSCPAGAGPPSPTDIAVTSVPIVVESTTDDYFVLYSSQTVDGTRLEYPVLVKRGEDGTTTLEENVEALPAERYRVEKYLITHPADVDGDCVDDITELDDPAGMNPVNPAHLDPADGLVIIPDEETFDDFSYSNILNIDDYRRRGDVKFIKFTILGIDTGRPVVYFIDKSIGWHNWFVRDLSIDLRDGSDLAGQLIRYDNVFAPDGSLGLYVFELDDSPGFAKNHYVYGLLAASIPPIADNLIYSPQSTSHYLNSGEQAEYEASRMDVMLDSELHPDGDFAPLNLGEGYGFLRVMSLDEQPNPRDIVIYESLPNDLPPVAGIITTVRQTPLSHVNLRAMQNGVPNAFVRNALDNDDIDDLIDSHVYYQVTGDGYTIRAATPAEVEAHYASARPAEAQTPERDLSVTTITPLSQVAFDDWNAFGVKAANVAVLGTLEFPEGTVPDGFAIPFYFYDEFMKHNELYDDIEEMLANSDFQTDYDTMASELKKLRKKIKKAEVPDWIETALTAMHATYPEGQSLRYRSSTNNEDRPGFNGAGLYDSNTQHPEETEEDGISKSLKQVYASLWNFRAFVEREFHRIDHAASAMGVLVHPNYSDERLNGVAVSVDPTYATEGAYYVNSQVGEDLVTNPEANSVPEELLLHSNGTKTVIARSNQATDDQLLMTSEQMAQLRRHLSAIHDKFEELYGIEDGEQFAMEIEFKITSDNVLAIKQARPWSFGPVASGLNNPATGLPVISGTPQVGETLTADTSGIADEDGLTNATFSYRWLVGDGASETDIAGAASSTYTLSDDEEGKTVKVRVSFTDDADNEETLTSEATALVEARANSPSTGAPTIAGAAQVGETLTADTSGIADKDGLANAAFGFQWTRNDGSADADIEDATSSTHTLTSDDEGKTVNVRVTFTDDAGNEETLISEATAAVEARPNDPATGQPTISGTPRVGETLTANTSGIADEDGLDNVSYSYQWTRNDGIADADIEDATASTHTLTSDDEGKTVNVRVTFTDDAGNEETLIGEATAAVEARPNDPATGAPTISGTVQVGETLTANTSGIADEDGLSNAAFSFKWTRNDGSADADIEDATSSTHTLTSDDEGKTINVRVTFTDDAGNAETLTSEATAAVEARANDPATGAPTISGTVQVGETLTANTSRIADEDGLTSVVFEYEWLANDAVIPGANDSSYVISDSDRESALRVRVSFTDDNGSDESLTSKPVAVEDRPYELTASAVDGGVVLTWKPPVVFPYLRDYQILRNRPELGETEPLVYVDTGNDETTYTDTDVEPGVLYVYRVKAASFWVGKASEPVEIRTPARTNIPATGAPTITGTVQVGETLTADTSGIADADGLSNAAFSFQWTRNDGSADADIEDATASTYTLTSDDEGNTIKVQVYFADDAGNPETLRSEATALVEAAAKEVVWESELTVGSVPNVFPHALGYPVSEDHGGSLSPDQFEIDGSVYNVDFLLQFAEGLWLGLDRELPAEFTLSVGESVYEGSESKVPLTGSGPGGYWWPSAISGWSLDESVRVSLTIQPREPMASREKAPLIAYLTDIPSDHDGQGTFTFELQFTEEPEPHFSYKTLRDHAFTVTGGSVVNARRLDKPSNIRWEITVRPDGNGQVTILLPATTDCEAVGAICTGDGRMLFNRIELTIAGPGGSAQAGRRWSCMPS